MTICDHEAFEPRLVLIVDDEQPVRSLLARAIALHGHIAIQASNGAEALEIMAAQPAIGAVMTDIRMPVIDGEQLTRALAASYPGIPVVLMSSHMDSMAWRLPNVKHVIAKPFSVETFIEKLDSMLGDC